MIEFKNVSKSYSNGTKALDGVNLKIEQGEFVFVVGDSGAGKSTLLKIMMREEVASEGTVIIKNRSLNAMKKRDIPYFRRHLGIVFQDFRLIPNMTVYDNVAFAMRVIGAKEKKISNRVPHVLARVGLADKAKCLPNELSGGEQQRVALARAIVNNADIIIADEPTGNVDTKRSFEIVEMLNQINASGTTVIMVTHSEELVRRFGRRIITIQDGKIVSDDVSNVSVEPVSETQVFGDLDITSKRAIREADEFIRSYNSTIEQDGGETDEQ
ncbi:MAG: cell division ATP-binding protein FtsE [Clostridia bacterium]|nr:cell division ATP-binding protein FtsE [Clostridia bacterium]